MLVASQALPSRAHFQLCLGWLLLPKIESVTGEHRLLKIIPKGTALGGYTRDLTSLEFLAAKKGIWESKVCEGKVEMGKGAELLLTLRAVGPCPCPGEG